MNLYQVIAWVVDISHVLIIIFWFTGFFVSKGKYPRYRKVHCAFGVVMFSTQLIFQMRCPLVLLSGYLREIAKPGFTKGSEFIYEPFTVKLLQNTFGFSPPDIIITVLTVLGTALMVLTFIGLSGEKSHPQSQQ